MSWGQAHNKQRTWPWWTSGAIALLIVLIFTLLPALAMVREAGNIPWAKVLSQPYEQRVIAFSFRQATLSTLLSIVFAVPVALALARKPAFPGRTIIVNLFSLSLVIPTVVAIYGIAAVFGRTGWLNQIIEALSLPTVSIYGLPGILIAHVFFNLPLAARVLLINLEGIPKENWRLTRQLGMKPWALFKYIEWPALRGQIPSIALLIFTLCFTSFAIVMTLGGGPRATTIEVAIFQALRFDFDIQLAVALASVQLIICVLLMLLSSLAKQNQSLEFDAYRNSSSKEQQREHKQLMKALWPGKLWWSIHTFIIAVSGVYILTPLLALLFSSLNPAFMAVLTHPTTLDALFNTIVVSLVSAFLSLGLAIGLLLSSRHLRVRLLYERSANWLQLSGNVILVLPPLVLGTGLFLLLRPYADVFSLALILVIVINSLMALPFILRVLDGPVMQSANEYDKLLQSLDIKGFNRLRIIDWPQLKKPIAFSLAIATTLSAGDLSAIALFGSERVRTLPLLLYQRIGSYRLDEAAVTAGMLLALCLILFMTIQFVIGGTRNAKT